MKPIVWLSLVWVLLGGTPGAASALEVVEGVISTQVVNHQPVDSVQSWPAASGQLFCFTRIVGVTEPTPLFHVWYRGQQEMARIELLVRSSPWNTWSVKALDPEWVGEWRVEVVDGAGNLLRTIPFTLL